LTIAAAKSLFKLMAYKDEYEVARLYTDGSFSKKLHETFEGEFRLKIHLAPPLIARRDALSGHLRKQTFGAWIFIAFRLLAKCKRLRGSWADPFGRTVERRTERALIVQFEAALQELSGNLRPENLSLAIEIASLPLAIKGYGHVKEASVRTYRDRLEALLSHFVSERTTCTGPNKPDSSSGESAL
jgi:indolepyruvate ferredoxin oxidoreductase